MTIAAVLRQKGNELAKSTSLFYQIIEYQGQGLPVQLMRAEVPIGYITLESLKVNVNVDCHKIRNSLWAPSLGLNLTECLL